MAMIEIILGAVAALGWLGWWITGRFGLELSHRHRIIEEHTKAVQRYVERYYVPYMNLSREIEGILSRKRQKETEDRKESFFRLAQWFYLRHRWSKDVGNILVLRDATAEKLLASLSKFHSKFFGADKSIGVVERHTLMKVLESNKRVRYFFDEFCNELREEPLESIFRKYEKWLSKKKEISLLVKELRCFNRIFYFEINMCYKSWYGKKPVRPKVDFSLVKERLDKLQDDGKIRLVDKKKYLRRIGYKGSVV